MPAVEYHYGKFPPTNIDWARLVPYLGPASAAVAHYGGLLSAVPNANILLSPLTTQEAVLSSRIEGTQATLGEVLEYEAEGSPDQADDPKAADINEIINYRKAIYNAADTLKSLPLSGRLICGAHEILMRGVRGANKSPGEYRRGPNWIGPPGSGIEDARYIPVSAEKLQDCMSAWEKFLHSRQPDVMVQLALAHAEFEAIHPFLDGNGRLGRMLIPLFLYERKVLAKPTFYLSAYLEANRDEYYERLLAVSRDGDWTGWCLFFLKAIKEQAADNCDKARQILNLYESKKKWILEATGSQHAIRALDYLFNTPTFTLTRFVAETGIPDGSAKRILKILRNGGLVKTIRESSGRKPALLLFAELLNIAEGRAVF